MTTANTHTMIIADAIKYDANTALILANLKYLQQQKQSKGGPTHDGKHWVNYTYAAMSRHHPYLSVPQLKRIMKKLTDAGEVIKEGLSPDLWNRELYWHVTTVHNVPMESTKSSDVERTESYPLIHINNIKQPQCEIESAFETFWKKYPNKVGKKGAKKVWMRLPADERLLAVNIPTYDNPKFIPLGTTYLNQGKWATSESRKSSEVYVYE